MTTFFIGRHRCYVDYAESHGFERMHPDVRKRQGNGIVFCNSIQAARGREVLVEDTIHMCAHCVKVASDEDRDWYHEVLDWLEMKQLVTGRIRYKVQKGLR